MCNEEKNQLAGGPDISAEILGVVNEPQLKALKMILSHKVSIVWGPPGTGKSLSLAALVRLLITNSDEKFVGTAMANVAVDALMESCVKLWRQLVKDGPSPPFVRVFSEAQIQSQWQTADYTTLMNEFHIDQLRFKKASQNPETWGDYLDGRRQLEHSGRIESEDNFKAYIGQARDLNAEIIDNDIRGAFCTITACQTPALYEVNTSDGKIKRFFRATTIVNDESSTSLRAHVMLMATTFFMARRLVLAGDWKQLCALLLTDMANEWWSPSFLERLKELRSWPYTLLDIQYRMHDALYAHLIKVVYKHPIRSHYLTANPSTYLQALMDSMPLRVSSRGSTWKLESFMHFIHVKGEQLTKVGGSSSNPTEAEFISSFVQSLIRGGRPKKSICVMLAYADQVKLLRKTATNDGWLDIKGVITADLSQGSEAEIIIFSIVRTSTAGAVLLQRLIACEAETISKSASRRVFQHFRLPCHLVNRRGLKFSHTSAIITDQRQDGTLIADTIKISMTGVSQNQQHLQHRPS